MVLGKFFCPLLTAEQKRMVAKQFHHCLSENLQISENCYIMFHAYSLEDFAVNNHLVEDNQQLIYLLEILMPQLSKEQKQIVFQTLHKELSPILQLTEEKSKHLKIIFRKVKEENRFNFD